MGENAEELEGLEPEVEEPKVPEVEDLTEEDDSPDPDTPIWMQEDEEDRGVPVAKHVALKHKLRGKIAERDEELEKLKRELAAIKSGKPATEAPKRPRMADFSTDEEYEEAMDAYEASRLEYLRTSTQQSTQEKELAQRRQQQIAQAVDGHYDRASKLVEEHSINPEVYRKADEDVKAVIETVIPKGGESVFNAMVDMIGEGSEKAMFYLGRNKTAQAEFANALRADPTGLKAATYLGRVAERVQGAKTRTSRAPSPATQLKGDGPVSAQATALRKKWTEAHRKGNAQQAYNLKKQARKAGIDTSSWG